MKPLHFVTLATLVIVAGVVTLLFQPSPIQHLPALQKQLTRIPKSPASVHFEEIGLSLGITFEHAQISQHLTAITETLGGGVCAFDANKDGWMDLFLVGGKIGRAHV